MPSARCLLVMCGTCTRFLVMRLAHRSRDRAGLSANASITVIIHIPADQTPSNRNRRAKAAGLLRWSAAPRERRCLQFVDSGSKCAGSFDRLGAGQAGRHGSGLSESRGGLFVQIVGGGRTLVHNHREINRKPSRNGRRQRWRWGSNHPKEMAVALRGRRH
jgi:hypothetical protein